MTNQSNAGSWFSAKKIASAVIALLLLVSMFATPALAGSINSYKVNLVVDSEAITVTTNETEPIEILKNAGFKISKNDKMNVSSFKAGVGGKIVVDKQKSISIEQNGKIKSHKVYASTVGNALKESGVTIKKNEKANYSKGAKVVDGMVITIKETFLVKIDVDGETKKFNIIGGTVKDLIKQTSIKLGKNDYTEPSLNSKLTKETTIKVYRVEYKTKTETEVIEYSTKEEKDNTLEIGTTKVVQKGVNGSKKNTYRVKCVNGKIASKKLTDSKTVKKPTTKIVKVGTKSDVKPNGVQSKNGYSLGQKISGRYTHYCVCSICNGNSRGITASGKKIWNGMKNPYYVACNWLPLGSVIKVGNQNYTVVDRGGSGLSKQGRIDIFTPEGHSAALRKGTGNCTITIIRLGW